MLALCRKSTATPAIAAKTITGHGSPSASADEGQRHAGGHRRQRGVAGDEEDDEPDRDPDQPEQRHDAEERPAPGRDRLAALLEAEEERPPVAEHRRAPREHADQLADENRADERGHEPLGDVEHDDRDPVGLAVRAPDVACADVAATDRADVLALEQEDEPVAERHRPQQVAAEDDEGAGHRVSAAGSGTSRPSRSRRPSPGCRGRRRCRRRGRSGSRGSRRARRRRAPRAGSRSRSDRSSGRRRCS